MDELMRSAEEHVRRFRTLFWFGGSFQADDIPFFVLRWRGEADDSVANRLAGSFASLPLQETWDFDCGPRGIRVITARQVAAERSASGDRAPAWAALRGDPEFVRRSQQDLGRIVEWLSTVDERPQNL